MRTGGDRRNREFAGPHVESAAPPTALTLAYDPQTAGGLLVSLPGRAGRRARGEFAARDLFLARIGAVEDGAGIALA